MAQLLKLQSDLIAKHRQILKEKDSQHLVDAPNPSSGFAVDSHVLLEPVTGPKGRLHTRRLGPFQVIGNKGSTYTRLVKFSSSIPEIFDWKIELEELELGC